MEGISETVQLGFKCVEGISENWDSSVWKGLVGLSNWDSSVWKGLVRLSNWDSSVWNSGISETVQL